MWIIWHHLYSPILHKMFYFRLYTRSIHPQQYLQWYLDFSLAHQSLWVLIPLSQEFLSHYISSLYYRKYCTISESGFKAAVEDIQINITASKAEFLEKATKDQTSSCIWYDHRIGRITASMMGKVANVWRENFLHHLWIPSCNTAAWVLIFLL